MPLSLVNLLEIFSIKEGILKNETVCITLTDCLQHAVQEQSRRTSLSSLFAPPSDDDEPASELDSREHSGLSVASGSAQPKLNLLPRVGEIPDDSQSRHLNRSNEPAAEHESLQRVKAFAKHRQLSNIFPGIGQSGFKSTQSLPAGGGRDTSARPPLPLNMQRYTSTAHDTSQVGTTPQCTVDVCRSGGSRRSNALASMAQREGLNPRSVDVSFISVYFQR